MSLAYLAPYLKNATEIVATYLHERHRFEANERSTNGDTIIGTAAFEDSTTGERITCTIKGGVGASTIAELKEGETYRFLGRWVKYKPKNTSRYQPACEEQFHFTSFTPHAPATKEGVTEYLLSITRQLKVGFGDKRAAACWESFGAATLDKFRNEPATVVEALKSHSLKISLKACETISAELQKRHKLEACSVELIDTLAGRQIPRRSIKKLIERWGNDAAKMVRRDPFRAFAGIGGVGFKRLDSLYLSLGLPAGRLKRQSLCAWYAIHSNQDGHTWHARTVAERAIHAGIGGAEPQFEKALRLARVAGRTAEICTDGINGPVIDYPAVAVRDDDRVADKFPAAFSWIAEGRKAKNESELAKEVARISVQERPTIWPDVASIPKIDDHQRGELSKALRGTVGILGGGPGTGKTFTVAAVVGQIAKRIGASQIAIGAPTGKAAVRVTEAMHSNGVEGIQARTWHSLLGFTDNGFDSCDGEKLPFKLLVSDETSMCDLDMVSAIFRLRERGCHVLLVGDINQLAPVGHGAPLRDLIRAGLPCGELREIKRNSGGIVEACAAIRDGLTFSPGDNLRMNSVAASAGADGIIERVVDLVCAVDEDGSGLDPVWDCQVLVPLNDKGPLSRKALNKILQGVLNPVTHPSQVVQGCPFRTCDKIVNLKNGRFLDASQDGRSGREHFVANGELGRVEAIEEKSIIVSLQSPSRLIRIPRGKQETTENDNGNDGPSTMPADQNDTASQGAVGSWDLGYALSVHKSQGSEWPVVITVLDPSPGAKMVCSREWIYTAISRAKLRQELVGMKYTADSMVRRVSLDKRKTLLKELIGLEVAKLRMGEI